MADIGKNAFEPSGTTMTISAGSTSWTVYAVEITPPAWDGGDAIDITTLGNTEFKTKMAQTLKDIGEVAFSCHYDPSVFASAPINVNGTIEIDVPNWGTLTVYGYLRSLTPQALVVGDAAKMDGSITVTNTSITGVGSNRVITEEGPSWS
ncbi:MAG: hypothetical protein FJ006_11605 [Chloroflexi bacterium]|nr:hypothetical protein [Chloroflexota bacterium]